MEAAALRHALQARHRTVDRSEALLLAIEPRDRAQETDGVGMLRRLEERLHRRALDDLAGIHHHHLLRELGDDTEVVSDEHDRGAARRAELAEEVEDLRLDRDIERRR